MNELSREQKLYDKFVDTLLEKLDNDEITAKELEIVMKFLDNQNIQASNKHQGLSELAENAMKLPFEDEDELPTNIRRVK